MDSENVSHVTFYERLCADTSEIILRLWFDPDAKRYQFDICDPKRVSIAIQETDAAICAINITRLLASNGIGNVETYLNKEFKPKDVERSTGLSKMQIIHLSQNAIIIPHIDQRGRGHGRTYNGINRIEFLIVSRLRQFKIEMQVIKEILAELRERSPHL